MADRQTLGVYDRQSTIYMERGVPGWERRALAGFLRRLPRGGRVLDLGCGPGHASAAMAEAGFRPDPVDASEGMVRLARDRFGVPARVAGFEDIPPDPVYAGIWANFSLLHVGRDELPALMARLGAALLPGGWMHLGMKMGRGEARDDLGRFYTYWSEVELRRMLSDARLLPEPESLHGRGTGLDGTPFAWCLLSARAPEVAARS